MPTYRALGVTATLSVADLEDSISNVVNLRQGKDQQKDADRIYQVLSGGKKLREAPIGADGTTKGVLQFIGEKQDLPFYMVEARSPEPSPKPTPEPSRESSPEPEEDATNSDVVEEPDGLNNSASPLASLPTDASNLSSSRGGARMDSFFDADPPAPPVPDAKVSAPQAITLTIDLTPASFLRRAENNKADASDLRTEVFINGQFVGTSYYNKRLAVNSVSEPIKPLLFSGTRIHRQGEKPWIWRSDLGSDSEYTSPQRRWLATGEALLQEAQERGRNKLGHRSPVSDYLAALSTVPIAERLMDKDSLGTIDIIIVAGKGKKYGPEAGYATRPARMDDRDYVVADAAPTETESAPHTDLVANQDFKDTGGTHVATPSPILNDDLTAPASSPEVPLMNMRSAIPHESPNVTPKKRKADLFAELSSIDKDIVARPVTIQTCRGKHVRSLDRGLADIRMMSEDNRQIAYAALEKELGSDAIRTIQRHYKGDGEQSSPTKKARLQSEDGQSIDTSVTEVDTTELIKPVQTPVQLPASADMIAVLAQSRIDMALQEGVGSNGPLLRRIANLEGNRHPSKQTPASALANSPTRQPIKEQPHMRKKPVDPPATGPFNDVAAGSFDAAAGTPTRPNKRIIRGQNEVADALKAFKVPELFEGSTVTYAGQGIQRQITKARNGEFKEEELIVGMRFVVV